MTTSPALTDEQRTSAFQARMSRKKAPILRRLWEKIPARHRGRRLTALAVAIAVPAVAAPGQWDEIQSSSAEAGMAKPVKRMAFEQVGQSFPGSAFYYLEDAPRVELEAGERELALFDISGTGDVEATELVARTNAGPAARAFNLYGGGLDQSRAQQCLTKAIYYESASEAEAGQRAVAQVVLNRVAHPSYPNSVCGVVFQGSERRTGCQFSFTCDGSLRRVPSAGAWARAQRVATSALAGSVYAPVGLATHYHTIWIYPYWAPSLDPVGTIGAHRFYKWKGSAGKAAAFRSRYAGSEPSTRSNPRAGSSGGSDNATDLADPLALAKAFEEGRLKAVEAAKQQSAPAARAPAPRYSADVQKRGGDTLYTAENLPDTSNVKPEYANSGRWIAEPK